MAGMHRLAPLLLGLVACSEPGAVRSSPTDRFAVPATLALYPRASGGAALLVASGNYDLKYDGATGGSLLSVDPSPYVPPPDPLPPGYVDRSGSLGRPGGALVKYGAGANVPSYAGYLVVADKDSCPLPETSPGQRPEPSPEALLVTRFSDQLWRLPLGQDGEVEPCTGPSCAVKGDSLLKDPFGLALACRPDGRRRTAYMGYLRTAQLTSSVGLAGYLVEIDLNDPTSPTRALPLGQFALAGLTYDGEHDRLFVLGRPLLAAPVYVVDLFPCPAQAPGGAPTPLASCPLPTATSVDLTSALPGLDLQDIALSNPQAGQGRRAYVSARVYDAGLAALIQSRPSADVAGALLVLDLEPDLTGRPSLRVLRIVHTGLGASQVKVLPVRDPVRDAAGLPVRPRRDVVVVSSITDGMLTVYDDDAGEVVRVLPVDEATGAPEVGRGPFGLAALRLPGATPADDVARVFVAASGAQAVGVVDVPLLAPGEAHARDLGTGALMRIGGLQ